MGKHFANVVCIESPYSGDVERNQRYLRDAIRDCLKRGESPYASHRMLTDALDDTIPEEREAGMEAGFAIQARTDLVVVYADLGISGGMVQGMERARATGLAVVERHLGQPWSGKAPSEKLLSGPKMPDPTSGRDDVIANLQNIEDAIDRMTLAIIRRHYYPEGAKP